MFSKIEDLLGMLGNVHSGDRVSNEPTQIVNTLRLMEFLHNVQSEEAYVRYVHQLASMQSNAGNHTEAGLALQLHADRYQWDTTAQVGELKELELPSQSAFERKEALYVHMVQHFELGQCWQKVLAVYKELANQYETNVFDFAKLARAQRAMASVHEKLRRTSVLFQGTSESFTRATASLSACVTRSSYSKAMQLIDWQHLRTV